MRTLATLMLMVALVAMTVSTAGADIKGPACPSQMRLDNMCYATAVPAAATESAKKGGGVCCDLFAALVAVHIAAPTMQHWLIEASGRSSLFTDRYLWRPPRA